MKTGNAKFIKNSEKNENKELGDVIIQEVRVQLPLPRVHNDHIVPNVVEQIDNNEQQVNDEQPEQPMMGYSPMN